jgi:hypothetical protein
VVILVVRDFLPLLEHVGFGFFIGNLVWRRGLLAILGVVVRVLVAGVLVFGVAVEARCHGFIVPYPRTGPASQSRLSHARRSAPTLTALAVTMAAIASQSTTASDWPRTTRPVSAAKTGLTLMNTPKNLAGTRRTGTTTPDLWPAAARPQLQDTRDIDDWLAIIAAGGGIGITPEGTTAQYRRDGVVFRRLRGAPPITVQMIWRRHDPHPSTHVAVALLTELYRRPF